MRLPWFHRSLGTDDPELAKRLLKEEIAQTAKVDQKLAKTSLAELLQLYEERLNQYALRTVATRKSILKIFKETWKSGLEIPAKKVSPGQIELWLASRRSHMKNATYNEYARFVRHVFELGVKLRVLSASPAADIKGARVEAPIRMSAHFVPLAVQPKPTTPVYFSQNGCNNHNGIAKGATERATAILNRENRDVAKNSLNANRKSA